MTRVHVLQTFPLSRDGSTVQAAEAGEVIEIADDLLEGLLAAGLVEKAGGERLQPEIKADPADDAQADTDKAPAPRTRRENKDAGARSRRS